MPVKTTITSVAPSIGASVMLTLNEPVVALATSPPPLPPQPLTPRAVIPRRASAQKRAGDIIEPSLHIDGYVPHMRSIVPDTQDVGLWLRERYVNRSSDESSDSDRCSSRSGPRRAAGFGRRYRRRRHDHRRNRAGRVWPRGSFESPAAAAGLCRAAVHRAPANTRRGAADLPARATGSCEELAQALP